MTAVGAGSTNDGFTVVEGALRSSQILHYLIQGEDDRNRPHNAGSERGSTLDGAARHGRRVLGVSDSPSPTERIRNADPQQLAKLDRKRRKKRRSNQTVCSGCADHEDEGRADLETGAVASVTVAHAAVRDPDLWRRRWRWQGGILARGRAKSTPNPGGSW
jgi:hypothetical protein